LANANREVIFLNMLYLQKWGQVNEKMALFLFKETGQIKHDFIKEIIYKNCRRRRWPTA